MAAKSGRSEQEIEQLISGFKTSGLTRRQYCEQQGIAVTTFDYYRRSRRDGKQQRQRGSMPLVKVELTKGKPAVEWTAQHADASGFTLVLANSRRIESGWQYAEQELARLIRIVEAA